MLRKIWIWIKYQMLRLYSYICFRFTAKLMDIPMELLVTKAYDRYIYRIAEGQSVEKSMEIYLEDMVKEYEELYK